MPIYDTTFIINPQLEEAGIDGRIKEVIGYIENGGGKLVKENRLGMRRMAYEIKGLTQGYYVSLVYEGTGEIIREIESRFRIDDNCLRFLTCLFEEVSQPVIRGGRDRDDDDSGHDDNRRYRRHHRDDDYDRGRGYRRKETDDNEDIAADDNDDE